MNKEQLNVLYWIIAGTLAIMVFILVIHWEKKAKKEKKWAERDRQLNHLLGHDWDENSYT
jgi:hypothetical protein